MKNNLKENLKSGKPCYGVWSILSSPTVNEIIGIAGFDFQILDMEHGVHDISTLEASIRACELHNSTPLVRLPTIDQGLAQKVLDLGGRGLIIPQIKNFAQAEEAVKLLYYAPVGVRGYNPFTRGNMYKLSDKHRPGDLICGIIIENKSAFDDLDQILKIENLDVVYLGAYDMSVALGKPGDMSNPDLLRFIDQGIQKIKQAGKIAGLMADPDALKEYAEQGVGFLVCGVDSYLIGDGLKKVRERVN